MPRKKHTKCSTEGCIGIRANRGEYAQKCVNCKRALAKAVKARMFHRYKGTTFSPGIDKFRSKAPPR